MALATKVFDVPRSLQHEMVKQLDGAPDPFGASHYIELSEACVVCDQRVFAGPTNDPTEIEAVVYRATVVDHTQVCDLPAAQQTMPSSVGPAELHLGPSIAAAVWNIKHARLRLELWGKSKDKQKWLLGSTDVALNKVFVGSPVPKTFVFKQSTAERSTITMRMSLMIHALDQEQMKAQFRAQHRAAITIFIQAAGERSKSTDDGHAADQTQVASVFTDDEYELLQIHADYVQILPAESISDCVCAWVEMGIPGGGKACGRLLPWLLQLEEVFNKETHAATSLDIAKLRMALIAIVDACIQAASDPILSFCPDTLGSNEKAGAATAACIRALTTAGSIRVWEEPPRTLPTTDDVVLARLFMLLQGPDKTLARIKSTLVDAFGHVAVNARNQDISDAVISEMQSRRVRKGRSVSGGRRNVAIELNAALCENASYRYQSLRTTYDKVVRDWFESNNPQEMSEATDQERHLGMQVLTLTRTIHALGREMEAVVTVYQDVYSNPPASCDVVWAFAKRYDRALAKDLKSTLSFLDHRIEMSTDKVSDLFDLYMVTRKFTIELTACVGAARAAKLHLATFFDHFEPFVVRWIRASQKNARMWAANSIGADSWVPVTAEELYSTSVLDISRGLSEILLLYRKLDWPDLDTASIVFTPAVINIVSDVAAAYADQTRDCFLGPSSPSLCLCSNTSSWIVDTAVCCALNNLDEMASKVQNLLATIPVPSEQDVKVKQLADLLELESDRCQRRMKEAKKRIVEAVAEWLTKRLGQDLCEMVLKSTSSEDDWETRIDAALGSLLDVPAETRFLDPGALGDSHRAKRVHGYLCANMMAFSTKLTEEKTGHQLAFSIWERMLQTLRACVLSYAGSVPRHLVPLGSCYEYQPPRRGLIQFQPELVPDLSQTKVATILMFILDQLVLFFSDDGDGLPHDTILGASTAILEPILVSCYLTSPDLIDRFLTRSISAQVGLIRGAEADARAGKKKARAGPAPAKEGELGTLRIRLNYDHGQDTLLVLVLEADVPGVGGLYYKLRRLPISETQPSKWRTDRRSEDSNLLIVPGLSESGIALQLRVHTHSFVKTQKQTFVGETLLCIKTIVETTRPLEFELPVESGLYTGSVGELQHLIKRRSKAGDLTAHSLHSLYSSGVVK
jgi:hypothetical protein